MSHPQSLSAIALDLTRLSTIDPLDSGELELLSTLGADHPPWPIDAIVLSARARGFIAQMARVVVPIFGYWDQHIRAFMTAAGELVLDAAGSYRYVR